MAAELPDLALLYPSGLSPSVNPTASTASRSGTSQDVLSPPESFWQRRTLEEFQQKWNHLAMIQLQGTCNEQVPRLLEGHFVMKIETGDTGGKEVTTICEGQ
ncbi:uncharacterized protein LOC143668049 [Tamandua tetradactyla]|uniref:uncharacterized protein LOC143668049 n=1 Tax=Tamandua tetradactyla TaxID=48850 RepID=UPI004053CC48